MSNPRIELLKRDAEQSILKPFRSHGWEARFADEHDYHSSIEIEATKKGRSVRIGLVYSTATDNAHYRFLAGSCERIFFHGSNYELQRYTHGVEIPIEPMGDFFPYLVGLNRALDPSQPTHLKLLSKGSVQRITDENPSEAVRIRLQQLTSETLAKKLILKRANADGISLSDIAANKKAEGVAFAMRNALDYFAGAATDKLNRRILSLYYGALAFAFAEMMAAPSGASDLDEVEGMTKQGHGLYTLSGEQRGFADLRVGVLATGFLPRWIASFGYDTSDFPRQKPKNLGDLEKNPEEMQCRLSQLFASMPEIDGLYGEVFDEAPRWLIPVYSFSDNQKPLLNKTKEVSGSTYIRFFDYSGRLTKEQVELAGWPIAEIRMLSREELESEPPMGQAFQVRVDHDGIETWWGALPIHTSPYRHRITLLLPTLGRIREYRVVAVATLYALSILVRYLPSIWRRVEGGEDDQYLALVSAALSVWERLLPQQFLESITNEHIHTAQPGSWMS